jgi:NADH-quinone oxidoreductase subunit G
MLTMATIHVDGKEYDVDGADNLLQACLSLGLDIPYFCWHPALGSVGACRQCAVKQYQNAEDTRGRLVMSCMTPASDGTFISIDDAEAKQFRESVVEWLMTNHPHDCPVCEEGGNCHLQDMTVMTGHSFRKYRFSKRTHNNQELGPFISHEMNRCIACYRCVRYYKDYADGTDFGVYGAHDNVYFGRVESGTLESEFSGNLVEVCPTGVFTDKTHSERYNRKWDMQFAPSICQQCSAAAATSARASAMVNCVASKTAINGSVNHYFLCDRGRFGYGYVNRKTAHVSHCRPRQRLITLTPNWMQSRGHPASGEEHRRYRLTPRQPRKQLRVARAGRCRALLHRYRQPVNRSASAWCCNVLQRQPAAHARTCAKSKATTRYSCWVKT